MTMTIDLPVDVIEKVRSEAALRGIQLEVLLLEKIQTGVSARKEPAQERPWMKHFGSLRNFHDERKEIESRIEEEFGQVDATGWK
jgi:hypothetical protein